MAKLSDSDLLNICKQESYQAESYVKSEISDDREDALERYFGEAYGDEQPGRSAIVTRDVLETIEWIMPSLLKVFMAGDDIVRYAPVGPEDEEFAEQATDLANVVFHKDNNGFLILNTWFKDALLQKMGVVKSFWNEQEIINTTTHEDLTLEELIALASAEGAEIKNHTEKNVDGSALDDMEYEDGFQPDTLHDVTITTTSEKNRIEIVPIPPEEFFMSYDAMDPDDAVYLEHRTSKTKTQLLHDGFSKKVVNDLPIDSSEDTTGERQTRMGQTREHEENADATMHEVTVYESYVFADTDGDGKAEWNRVLWAGYTVLEREIIDKQPFSTICPIPVPHRAYGLSLADLVMDIARIRTVIMRGTLDNLYLANNPEREVDVNKIVDMDDFLTTRPGGIKRVEQVGASREINHPFVAQHSFPMLDGLDAISAKRTGVSDMTMGVDADALANQTATASNNAMATKNQRTEMIARIFAETGVKHLFRRILHLLIDNQDKARVVKLRNKWVEMDTQQWNPEMDVTIDVGLGNGNRDQQMSHLNNILSWQKELLASGGLGMITPKHVYNTMSRMLTTIGFKNTEPFLTDPGDQPMQQPQQENPQEGLIQAQMEIEKGKAQVAMQKAQMDNQTKMEMSKLDHHAKMQGLELEAEKLDIDRERIAASMNETAAKIRSDEAKAAADLDAKAQIELSRMNDKDTDRQMSAMQSQANRDSSERASMNKAQKQASVTSNADGSLGGTID